MYLFMCMSVCLHVSCAGMLDEAVRSSGARVMDGCEHPCGLAFFLLVGFLTVYFTCLVLCGMDNRNFHRDTQECTMPGE